MTRAKQCMCIAEPYTRPESMQPTNRHGFIQQWKYFSCSLEAGFWSTVWFRYPKMNLKQSNLKLILHLTEKLNQLSIFKKSFRGFTCDCQSLLWSWNVMMESVLKCCRFICILNFCEELYLAIWFSLRLLNVIYHLYERRYCSCYMIMYMVWQVCYYLYGSLQGGAYNASLLLT